ncbi:hypothetical protein ACFX5K_01240 [Rickettsiales bacterium LUAb2]
MNIFKKKKAKKQEIIKNLRFELIMIENDIINQRFNNYSYADFTKLHEQLEQLNNI